MKNKRKKWGSCLQICLHFSSLTVEDWWIDYPWDAQDIDEHNRLAAESRA